MANYATLKAAINAVIKTNGNKEITGQVLNQTLMAIVDSLGENYQFAGVAVPSTNPGTPDQNIFYLATQAGTYTNFGATVLPAGISFLEWNGSWSSETLFTIDDAPTEGSGNLVKSGGVKTAIDNVAFSTNKKVKDVGITDTLTSGSDSIITSGAVFDAFKNDGGAYDVSVHFPTGGVEGGNTYTLDGAIAMVPQNMQKGGMSIKFIQSSDNKYVQYRLMSDTFNTTPANWQGVDDEPTAGSDNLVKSGGVEQKDMEILSQTVGYVIPIKQNGYYIDLSGGVGTIAPINNPTYNASYVYKLQSVSEGDIVILNGKGGESPRLYAFVDEDYRIIEVYTGESSTVVTNLKKIAPANSAYIIINNIGPLSMSYYYDKNCLALIKADKAQVNQISAIATQANNKVLELERIDYVARLSAVGKVGYSGEASKKLFRCINYPITNVSTDLEEIPYEDGAIYTYDGRLYRWNGSDLVSFNKYLDDEITTINNTLEDLVASDVVKEVNQEDYLVTGSVRTDTLTWDSSPNTSVLIPVDNCVTVYIDNIHNYGLQTAFLDEDKNVITGNGIVRDIGLGKLLKVPSNAKYLYFLHKVYNGTTFNYMNKVIVIKDASICEGIYGNCGEYLASKDGFIPVNNSTVDITSPTIVSPYNHIIINCVEGDIFKIFSYSGGSPIPIIFADSNGNVISTFSRDVDKFVYRVLQAPENSKYLIVNTASATTRIIAYNKLQNADVVKIAASDSSDYEKNNADIICSGIKDNLVINAAITSLEKGGTIQLSTGTFYVTTTYGIFFGENQQGKRFINLCGSKPEMSGKRQTCIRVPQSTLNAVGVNSTFKVISGTNVPPVLPEFSTSETYEVGDQVTYNNKRWECIVAVTTAGAWNDENWAEDSTYTYSYVNSVRIEYITMVIASNSTAINSETGTSYGRKTIGIDCRNFGTADLYNVIINTDDVGRRRRLHLKAETPVKDSIGVYSLPSNNDRVAEWSKVRVSGFYIGFYVKGVDHLIATWCDGCRCCYAFYFAGSIYKAITFINCADEGCTHLPYFAGNIESHIEILDYCIEPYNNDTSPDDPEGNTERQAVEENAGTYKGTLTYNMHGVFPGIEEGSRFWKNGSGHGMVTRNLMNPRTSRAAYPEYLERVFNPTTGKWSTYNGSEWIEES